MLIVDDCIISEDLADRCFSCDLAKCKGMCCVEGDDGAPLEESEIPVLNSIYPEIKPYLTPEGIAEIEKNGVSATDSAGEPCTPLVNGKECAYTVWENGTALCGIEKAFFDGKTSFRKPVSCHLYPIRIDDYGEFKTVNYHTWDICDSAVKCGEKTRVPLYRYLKEPLIRKFGREWYDELVSRCEEFLRKDTE